MVDDLESRIQAYANKRELKITRKLGEGIDGLVIRTEYSALKAFYRADNFDREVGCYQRLAQHGFSSVAGFNVPQYIDSDRDLMVLEMTIVTAPYVLDFGKAYLDYQRFHSPETLEHEAERYQELWGDHWPDIQRVLWKLEAIGIYYVDPLPGNLLPPNWNPQL
jgi:hypothetical protein